MEKQNINDLINKAKSSNQQKAIQKIVPIVTKEIEEVQFSFYIDKELLKKYVPGSEVFQTSNQLGATGDFIPVFEKNNIKTANLEVLNIFPFIFFIIVISPNLRLMNFL